MNAVFNNALNTMRLALASIEAEIDKQQASLASIGPATAAAQAHLTELRRNEADLNATVNNLAQEVAAARAKMPDADAEIKKKLDSATAQANTIIANAQAAKDKLIAEGNAEVDRLKAIHQNIRDDIKSADDALDKVKAKVAEAQRDYTNLKQAALSFANK